MKIPRPNSTIHNISNCHCCLFSCATKGECDIVLVNAPQFETGTTLDIHARTTIRYAYSFITSAALRIGSDTLEVTSFGQYSVGGIGNANLEGTKIAGFPVYHTQPNDKHHIFDVVIGPNENITLSSFKDLVSVKIAGGSQDHFGSSVGVMGCGNAGREV